MTEPNSSKVVVQPIEKEQSEKVLQIQSDKKLDSKKEMGGEKDLASEKKLGSKKMVEHEEEFQHDKSIEKEKPIVNTVHDKPIDQEKAIEKDKPIEKEKSSDQEKPIEVLLPDVRIAVLGNVDSSKSTLIGVLAGAELDNGRGSAREAIFCHPHERATGRTSSIAHHLLGYNKTNQLVKLDKNVLKQNKNKVWPLIVANSSHLVTLIDLAGHEAYLKTTISGLCGSHVQFALVIVNSLAGVAKMTREHLAILLACGIPFACVVSKLDLCPEPVLQRTMSQLNKILKSKASNKMPIVVRTTKDVRFAAEQLNQGNDRICPIVTMSCVTGQNLPLLELLLGSLEMKSIDSKSIKNMIEMKSIEMKSIESKHASGALATATAAKAVSVAVKETKHDQKLSLASDRKLCFEIDQTWRIPGVGLCVSGTVLQGTLRVGSSIKIGPTATSSFVDGMIKSIHYKRVGVASCPAGYCCAIALRITQKKEEVIVRSGMLVVDDDRHYLPSTTFLASIHILHHPTTIKPRYQTMIHCGSIHQTATLTEIFADGVINPDTTANANATASATANATAIATASAASVTGSSGSTDAKSKLSCLRNGDYAHVKFTFLSRPEYMRAGAIFLFREGTTKGIGKVLPPQ